MAETVQTYTFTPSVRSIFSASPNSKVKGTKKKSKLKGLTELKSYAKK